jgi:glutamyl-tRNA(Gln) amidotransferase subunit E
VRIAGDLLPVIFEHPKMDFDSVLTSIKFKRVCREEILAKVDFLIEKFRKVGHSQQPDIAIRWIMGELRSLATGNIPLRELKEEIQQKMGISDERLTDI